MPLPGTVALALYLQRYFPLRSTELLDCRPNTANTARTSIHGTGRAIDAMIHAGTREGDAIADWLVTHATDLGVQYVIWDHVQWNPSRAEQFRPYTGPNPHTDHVHLELNQDGGAMRTAWFQSGGPERSPGDDPSWWKSLVVPVLTGGMALGAYVLWERR
jgi:hypothetical protein